MASSPSNTVVDDGVDEVSGGVAPSPRLAPPLTASLRLSLGAATSKSQRPVGGSGGSGGGPVGTTWGGHGSRSGRVASVPQSFRAVVADGNEKGHRNILRITAVHRNDSSAAATTSGGGAVEGAVPREHKHQHQRHALPLKLPLKRKPGRPRLEPGEHVVRYESSKAGSWRPGGRGRPPTWAREKGLATHVKPHAKDGPRDATAERKERRERAKQAELVAKDKAPKDKAATTCDEEWEGERAVAQRGSLLEHVRRDEIAGTTRLRDELVLPFTSDSAIMASRATLDALQAGTTFRGVIDGTFDVGCFLTVAFPVAPSAVAQKTPAQPAANPQSVFVSSESTSMAATGNGDGSAPAVCAAAGARKWMWRRSRSLAAWRFEAFSSCRSWLASWTTRPRRVPGSR
ncbi:hypothetical protein NFJ02_13g12360 [Pycnococcus provasolii]